jgi:DNA-binding GntR family transcriptional regulator
MARRYNASTAEIDAALEELVGRHLIRRLPDGQLYRASPADYLIRLDGMPGLASHIDPMGAVITCRSFHASLRRAPEEIAQALGIGPSPVCVARLMWTANGQPAALATTYLTRRPPGLAIGAQPTRACPVDHGTGSRSQIRIDARPRPTVRLLPGLGDRTGR